MRLRVANYMEIIIHKYDIELLMKSQKALEAEFLLKGIDDQSQDVRKQVRFCWRAYYQVAEFSPRVTKMISEMRGPAKK